METRTPRAMTPASPVRWLHWLFVRQGRAISCDIDVSDGLYTIALTPLWSSEGHLVEAFASLDDAMRWHGQLTRHLRASGWLLADSAIVQPAA